MSLALVAPLTITFNAGDILSIVGIPSGSVTLGITAIATLIVIL